MVPCALPPCCCFRDCRGPAWHSPHGPFELHIWALRAWRSTSYTARRAPDVKRMIQLYAARIRAPYTQRMAQTDSTHIREPHATRTADADATHIRVPKRGVCHTARTHTPRTPHHTTHAPQDSTPLLVTLHDKQQHRTTHTHNPRAHTPPPPGSALKIFTLRKGSTRIHNF